MKAIRIGLALILLIYSIPVILSGLDIYKGTEPDLASEWVIVSFFYIFSIVLFIFNLLEIIKRDK